MFFCLLDFCFSTAPRIFAISLSKDKCSYRNFAKLSAWFVRFAHLSKDKTQIVRMPSRFLRRSYICLLFAFLPRREFNNTSPIRSVLINEMCLFEVSVRKANAEISAEQDGCTRMRGTVLRKLPRRRSGIIRGRYLSMRVPPVFPASDGQFCRESTLFEWWKKYRRGPERWGNSICGFRYTYKKINYKNGGFLLGVLL